MKRVVKTIYDGMVAIPDYEVEALLNRGRTLEIVVPQEGIMTIPSYEIKDKVVLRSTQAFKHKYDVGDYHLYYFKWKPNLQVRLV